MSIQIFVVFHKKIFDDCYKNIPQEYLDKYFTFYAVNEKIEKEYTEGKYKIIKEWELPIYDSTFQERGYNENSALYHIYANDLYIKYDYIGFFQYDMEFPENIIELIQSKMGDGKFLAQELRDYHFCTTHTLNDEEISEFIAREYEEYFGRPLNRNLRYPLLNTYVLPRDLYEKIMKWIVSLYDKMYPWCISSGHRSFHGIVGGIYERVMGLSIGNEGECVGEVCAGHEQEKYKSQVY